MLARPRGLLQKLQENRGNDCKRENGQPLTHLTLAGNKTLLTGLYVAFTRETPLDGEIKPLCLFDAAAAPRTNDCGVFLHLKVDNRR